MRHVLFLFSVFALVGFKDSVALDVGSDVIASSSKMDGFVGPFPTPRVDCPVWIFQMSSDGAMRLQKWDGGMPEETQAKKMYKDPKWRFFMPKETKWPGCDPKREYEMVEIWK